MDAKNILGSNKVVFSSALRPYYMSILCSLDLYKEVKWKKKSPICQLVVCQLLKPRGSLRKRVDDSDDGKYFVLTKHYSTSPELLTMKP